MTGAEGSGRPWRSCDRVGIFVVSFFNVAFSFVYGLPPHAEVSGYRFQPQRQRHILEDTPEASDHEKKDTREAELTKKN